MSKVVITKKPNDPLCTRVSIGGSDRLGHYFVYRGKLEEAIKVAEKALEAAKKQLELGEPPVENN